MEENNEHDMENLEELPQVQAELSENPNPVEESDEQFQPETEQVVNYHHTTDLLVKSETKQQIEKKVSHEILNKTAADLHTEMQYEIQCLNHYNTSIINENKNRDALLENHTAEFINSSTEVENTGRMIQLLGNTIDNMEQNMNDLRAKINNFSANNVVKSNYDAIANCEKKIVNRKKAIIDLKNDLTKRRNDYDEKKQKRQTKLKKKTENIENINNKHATLDESSEDMTQLKRNVEEKVAKADEMIEKIRENKVKDLEMRSHFIQAAENAKVHLTEKFARLEVERNALQNLTDKRKEEFSSNEALVFDLQEKLQNEKSESQLLDQRLIEVQATSNQNRTELETKLTNFQNLLECKNGELITKNSELNNLSEKVQFLKSDYLEKCEEKNELLREMLEINAIHFKNRLVCTEKKGIFDNLHEKCSFLEMRNIEIANKIEEKEAELPKLNETLTKQKQSIEKNATKNNKLRKTLETALFKPNVSADKLNALKDDLNEKKKSLNDLAKQKKEMEKKLQVGKRDLENYKSQLEILKTELRSDFNQLGGASAEKKVKFNENVSFKSTTESTDFSGNIEDDVRSVSSIITTIMKNWKE